MCVFRVGITEADFFTASRNCLAVLATAYWPHGRKLCQPSRPPLPAAAAGAEVEAIQSNLCAATTTAAADSSTGTYRHPSPSQPQSNQHKMAANRLALNCLF